MMMLSECEREADGSPHTDRPLLSLFHMMEWDIDESVLTITYSKSYFYEQVLLSEFDNSNIQYGDSTLTVIDIVDILKLNIKGPEIIFFSMSFFRNVCMWRQDFP